MSIETNDKLEAEFVSLVKKSWKTHQVYFWNNSVDEILIGAVVNASLEKGYLLIDLVSERPYNYYARASASDPTATGYLAPINTHLLRFEDPKDNSRLLYQLERITTELAETRVLGNLAKVTIGYGKKADNFNQVVDSLKQDFKSSFVDTTEPGIITLDAEMISGYVYAKVPIIVNISDYNIDNKLGNIDYDKLDYHLQSVVHSLRKYLMGRGLI